MCVETLLFAIEHPEQPVRARALQLAADPAAPSVMERVEGRVPAGVMPYTREAPDCTTDSRRRRSRSSPLPVRGTLCERMSRPNGRTTNGWLTGSPAHRSSRTRVGRPANSTPREVEFGRTVCLLTRTH